MDACSPGRMRHDPALTRLSGMPCLRAPLHAPCSFMPLKIAYPCGVQASGMACSVRCAGVLRHHALRLVRIVAGNDGLRRLALAQVERRVRHIVRDEDEVARLVDRRLRQRRPDRPHGDDVGILRVGAGRIALCGKHIAGNGAPRIGHGESTPHVRTCEDGRAADARARRFDDGFKGRRFPAFRSATGFRRPSCGRAPGRRRGCGRGCQRRWLGARE